MDRIDAMRLFVRIVDRRNFTRAAQDLNLPRSTASQIVRQLESRLGVRLLQRTTRTVRPTLDGEAYYRRCLAILDDIEDAEGAFLGASPQGMLRVEVQGTIARHFLMPGLPDFLDRHPQIELSLSEGDRWVDMVREGVDCVLRYGVSPDSELVARTVTTLERVTCAAPAYLDRHGRPHVLRDLVHHQGVGIRAMSSGRQTPFEFVQSGARTQIDVPTRLVVTGTETFRSAVLLGLGLGQLPLFHIQRDLDAGRLVRLLADYTVPPAPVSLLYPPNRQLSPRVRLFLDWAAARFRTDPGSL